MPLEATIAGFAAALCDSRSPAPPGTLGPHGRPDRRRFSIYRNNVAVGLIAAIEARYPIVKRIVGAETFRTMARAFAEHEKPRTPVLIAYGETFPDFIADGFSGLGIPYLADLARLENAWVESYHAEDASAAGLADLAVLDANSLSSAEIVLHPAAHLLRLATPAASIWAAFQDGAQLPPNPTRSEDVLLTRPEADVSVRILPACGYAFAKRLQEGTRLDAAAESLADPDEFGSHLVGLVAAGAVKAIYVGKRP
jgi:hypothetical protein